MNDNSVDLINKVVSLAKDDKNESKSTTLYGTVKKDGDKTYVRIDGSDILTPCTSTINVEQDERVRVVIANHEAIIVGNLTSVGARQKDVDTAKEEVIAELDERVENSLTAYEEKLKAMNELAANTLGFYYTEEKDENGATIAYRHDQPTLEGSTVIYKSGIDGFFLSTDGGNSWKAGFDSNGDAVLNILYAIGIQAKWINTRGFSAIDNEGKETFRIDEETGRVYIDSSEFFLGDKAIMDAINGFDPDMEMSKSGNTLTISFLDKNGVRQTYTVKDGANGKDGADGKDGKDGSSTSLTSYEIWQLLLQTNTDFLYRGSDNKLYIKASYIDTGNFCGFEMNRINKSMYARVDNLGSGSDSDDPDMIDLSLENGSVYIDASKAMFKTTPGIPVYGGYQYAAMQGDKMVAREMRCNRFFVKAGSSLKYNVKMGSNSNGSYFASPAVYSYPALVSSALPVYINSNGTMSSSKSSSKRFKRDFNYEPNLNIEGLFNLPVCTYKYVKGYFENPEDDETVCIGIIAEDVAEIDDRLVIKDDEGKPLMWDQVSLIPFMIAAIQDNHKRIKELETENEELKKRLDKIEEKLGI